MTQRNALFRILSVTVCIFFLITAPSLTALAGSGTEQTETETTEEMTEAAPETEADGELEAAMKMLRANL